MKQTTLWSTILLGLGLISLSIPSASAEGFSLALGRLSGKQETTPVETNARGRAVAKIKGDNSQVLLHTSVRNLKGVTEAHLHCGEVGQSGPVVVPLLHLASAVDLADQDINFTLTNKAIAESGKTCGTPITTIGDLIKEIEAGKIYINFHTTVYPDGELRGQLH